jgi:perosamine synthetase
MTQVDTESLIITLRKVLPSGRAYELHEPQFAGNEKKYVGQCIDVGWVSSGGEYVNLFEKNLALYTGVQKAICTSNGTSALHLCLRLLEVTQNDEVLVPALTFIATVNAIAYTGATPNFVDVSEKTLGVCPVKLKSYLKESFEVKPTGTFNKKTGKQVKALVAMHAFGHPVDLDEIVSICQEYKIEFVEDAAEGLGSRYHGKHVGHWGKVSALSFNGNKIITTGGGGAVITNDEAIGKRAKHLSTQAKLPHTWRFDHDETGYNYRMPNINAALGCAQLEQLDGFLNNKRKLALKYAQAFEGQKGIHFFKEPKNTESNYWLNVIAVKGMDLSTRENILASLHEQGIRARPLWTLMHKLPMYKNSPRADLSVSERIEDEAICLPSSAALGLL